MVPSMRETHGHFKVEEWDHRVCKIRIQGVPRVTGRYLLDSQAVATLLEDNRKIRLAGSEVEEAVGLMRGQPYIVAHDTARFLQHVASSSWFQVVDAPGGEICKVKLHEGVLHNETLVVSVEAVTGLVKDQRMDFWQGHVGRFLKKCGEGVDWSRTYDAPELYRRVKKEYLSL